eukprot:TRINITY_DN935_c1_g1_i1.p2 TRINITY_DN935_c1_g1~~TRINITY_DN935_c1_g1_i1.p2  ORF type:complete len:205 (-),score=25.41 TRINITY_DN935_c1_g1_i1:295-909(-)
MNTKVIFSIAIVLAILACKVTAQVVAISTSKSIVTSGPMPSSPLIVPSPSECACDDNPPPAAENATQYTCEEQKEFEKCDADFMLGYCDCTCDRCCPCNNFPPMGQNATCLQLKEAGECDELYMVGYCECDCDRCSGEDSTEPLVFDGCDAGFIPVEDEDICETGRCAINRQKCANQCGGLSAIDFECKDTGAAFSSSCACAGK